MVRERKASTVHIGCQPQNLSFSGCGFLGVYHIGVASCFKQHAPVFLRNLKRLYGCSAGSIIGAMLLSDVCSGELCRSTLDIVKNVRSRFLGPLSPWFSPNRILLNGLRRVLPPDAHVRCSGVLHISLTRVSDMKNVIVSEFSTRDELIDALLCSSFVPLYSGYIPPKYKGVYYVDGGLTNNLPAGSDTITVSPWSGGSDICPLDDSSISLLDLNIANTSVQMTVKNLYRLSSMLFPPEGEILSDFCKQGFRETLRYLREHGLFETVNPTLRSMSFSSELEHVPTKRANSRKLSMSSKWIAMQSNTELYLEEMEWEESDESSSESSDGEYLMMETGNQSKRSSKSFELSCSGDAVISMSDSFNNCNNNHNRKSMIEMPIDMKMEDNPLLKFLPIATIVDMPSSLEDLQETLHLNLPHVVMQALEESYQNNNSKWHCALTKVVSVCGKPLVLTRYSLLKSYSFALFILRNAAVIPDHLKWLLSTVAALVLLIQNKFKATGGALVQKLQDTKDVISEDTKLLFCQLCIVVQLLLQKLTMGRQAVDFSWVLKLAKSTNTFSKLSSYLMA